MLRRSVLDGRRGLWLLRRLSYCDTCEYRVTACYRPVIQRKVTDHMSGRGKAFRFAKYFVLWFTVLYVIFLVLYVTIGPLIANR
jgi:hypothetical protein